jgi:hypothetical protein
VGAFISFVHAFVIKMEQHACRGGATMGHKEATAPLTFYKHAYVHKQKLEVEKSHE